MSSKMVNRTDYKPGEKVFIARRNLRARHVEIMTYEEREVVKRTATGYKVKMQYAHKGEYLMKDCDYFISTDVTEVIDALRDDLADVIHDVRVNLGKLEQRDRILLDLWYGGTGDVD